MSKNKLRRKLKRQKQWITTEEKRFWGFFQFWQIILDKNPLFCFLCGKYIPPAFRDSRIKKPYKNGDYCHESCWEIFMKMEHITTRLNDESELICHIDLGWKVEPKICRSRVKNKAIEIMKHLIEFHGWKKIPELPLEEIKSEIMPNDNKSLDKWKKLYIKTVEKSPEKWFNDNQLIWSDIRSIHFLKPNGKPFPKVSV